MTKIGTQEIFQRFSINQSNSATSTGLNSFGKDTGLDCTTPINGEHLASVGLTSANDYQEVIAKSGEAFLHWRMVPAPQRGEIVRQFGLKLRDNKDLLGQLVSLEMGKSLQEGWGEVQEMIDICDFAVGLSRQLYGLTMHSERPLHRMYEQWQSLGRVGIISAFNFPVAVWCWNSAIAWVCGNVTIWKPSEKAPLCALACQKLFAEVMEANDLSEGLSCVINGGVEVGQWLTQDSHVPLISATGSVRMGKQVGQTVAARLGRSILELGGNNAIIISNKADLESTLIGAVFGAVGTCGQRCTSTRRLIIDDSIYDEVISRLQKAYTQLKIGNPLDTNNHVGPLIDKDAVQAYQDALTAIEQQGGRLLVEGGVLQGDNYPGGCYVKPCIAEVENHLPIVQHETFAPILYLIKYRDIEEAIALQNGVPQGLSSAIMTTDMRESELFLSAAGSDCGIANVNIGTSGAEIGGAFGGEKETGGGRESGSDAWKAYMRRQTNTINYSTQVPLAQGIKFDL